MKYITCNSGELYELNYESYKIQDFMCKKCNQGHQTLPVLVYWCASLLVSGCTDLIGFKIFVH